MNLISELRGPLNLKLIKKASLYLRFHTDQKLKKELYLSIVRNIDFLYFSIIKDQSLGSLETSPEIIWLKKRIKTTPLSLLINLFLKKIMSSKEIAEELLKIQSSDDK